jgi:hypothetical protein
MGQSTIPDRREKHEKTQKGNLVTAFAIKIGRVGLELPFFVAFRVFRGHSTL